MLSKPIRAGLLLNVDNEQLIELVLNLLDKAYNTMVDNKNAYAITLIDMMKGFSVVHLTDNCFWNDNSSIRKDGHMYKHPIQKRKRDTGGVHH